MKIVLLGYMGSGKSQVGKALSAKLLCPFVDLDTVIEKEEKMTVSQLFSSKGEVYFRKKEYQVLLQLLEKKETMVLALGGGTPCYGNIMQLLVADTQITTYYLSASVATLTTRLFKEKSKRPMIAHLSEKEALNDFIRKHLFERGFYYNQAQKKIITDQKTIEQIVEEIVASLF